VSRIWSKSHEQRIAAAIDAMRAHATAFEDMSPAAVEDRKRLPQARWLQTYLPHYFRCEFAPVHYRLMDALDEPTMAVWAAIFRGGGKSAINTLGAPLRRLLHRQTLRGDECRFQVVGALTEDLAVDLLDMVRIELANNPRILSDYGERACEVKGEDAEWEANGVGMRAIGVRQTPRGALYRQFRPHAAILDDLEDRYTAKNPKRAQELRDLINQDWIPALEPDHWVMTICLTALGRTGLLAWARKHARDKDPAGRPLYKLIYQPALNKDRRSAWPDRFSDSGLARIRAMVGLRAWRQEYMLRTDNPDARFKPGYIRRFEIAEIAPRLGEMRKTCHVDPSATAKETNDFKAIVVLGQFPGDKRVFCLHAWIRHATPGQMCAEIWRVNREFGIAVACETNALKDFLWEAVRRYEDEKGVRLQINGVDEQRNKQDRILSNEPEFEQDLCHFDEGEGDQWLLIDQWLDLGRTGVHDDGPDAWDGARRWLPGGSAAQDFFYQGLSRRGRPADLLGTRDEDRPGYLTMRPRSDEDAVYARSELEF
jgi:predicted phage terminase large subunit-like protein